MFNTFITAGLLLATATARPQGPRHEDSQPRQLTYASPYALDLQYDFSLLDPQLQYPGYAPGPRLQPQVILYPGAPAGQPFLLQPGGHPGNFLVPQPPPGFVLRDAPQPNPVFVQGQPKPYVPPVNKDAEEIPTGPSLTAQGVQGRKPEKLETFDDSPEISSGEAEVLSPIDKTHALKPGQRFFILNGQPLFSNYPLPQFPSNTYQPAPERYGHDDRQPAPSFGYGGGFAGLGAGDFHQKEAPRPLKPTFDIKFNELDFPHSAFFGLNRKEAPQHRDGASFFKLRPIEVPDDETSTEEAGFGRDQAISKFESKKESFAPRATEKSGKEGPKEESVSQAEPGAIALAGPGGVASAAPRGTALSSQKGLSISSPKATAIAGPAKEKDSKLTKLKKDKQQ